MGPPIIDSTNTQGGNLHFSVQGGQTQGFGPLSGEDERELVQLFFEMIVNEKELEDAKQALVENADFNLMDAF